MEGRVRGPTEGNAEAKPVGCPWQLLQYTTQKIMCGNWPSSTLMDCEAGCEIYQHLQALNAQIQALKEKLPGGGYIVNCHVCTTKDVDKRRGQG